MRLHLIIDADDTLWENNIYFERAFEEFVSHLDHSRLGPEEIRAVLDEIETVNNKIHGYGSANFARNLRQCYLHLAEREIRTEDLDRVMTFGHGLLDHPMQVIEGVEETLRYLRPRHELILFTKGHPDEQRLKLDRSGLGRYFHHTAIVKEKDAAAYRKLAVGFRAAFRAHVDDRELAEIGRERGAGGGAEGGFHPSRAHLDSGAGRGAGSRWPPADATEIRRSAGAFLTMTPIRKFLRISLGFLLLAVGLLLSIPLVPGPGIVVIILGLVILSNHFGWARRLLEWAKRKAASVMDRVKRPTG